MNKQDRAAVIRAICKELQVQMLEQNERIPESWDGVELRQLLADTAANGTPMASMDDKRKGRRRAYEDAKARYRLG